MGDSLAVEYTWDRNNMYPWANWLLVGALILSITTNLVFLTLHKVIPALKSMYVAHLVVPLSIANLVHATVCFIQCMINMSAKHYVGEYDMCVFQAFYSIMITSWTSSCLCLMVYCSFRIIVDDGRGTKRPLKPSSIYLVLGGLVVYSLVMGVLSTLIVPKSAQLLSSGTYCIPSIYKWEPAFVFYALLLVPVLSLSSWWYYRILKTVRSMVQELKQHGIESDPMPKQINTIYIMSVLVLLTIVCYAPFVGGNIYEFIYQVHAPPAFYAIGGLTSHLPGFVNPILYFALNAKSWEMVVMLLTGQEHRQHRMAVMMRAEENALENQHMDSVADHLVPDSAPGSAIHLNTLHEEPSAPASPRNQSASTVASGSGWNAKAMSHMADKELMLRVLQTEASRQKFISFCKSEYNQENPLFWERANSYKTLVLQLCPPQAAALFVTTATPIVPVTTTSIISEPSLEPRTSAGSLSVLSTLDIPITPKQSTVMTAEERKVEMLMLDGSAARSSVGTISVAPAAVVATTTVALTMDSEISIDANKLRAVFDMAQIIYLAFVSSNGALSLNVQYSMRNAQIRKLRIATVKEHDKELHDNYATLGLHNLDWSEPPKHLSVRTLSLLYSMFDTLIEAIEQLMLADSFLRFAQENKLSNTTRFIPLMDQMKSGVLSL